MSAPIGLLGDEKPNKKSIAQQDTIQTVPTSKRSINTLDVAFIPTFAPYSCNESNCSYLATALLVLNYGLIPKFRGINTYISHYTLSQFSKSLQRDYNAH